MGVSPTTSTNDSRTQPLTSDIAQSMVVMYAREAAILFHGRPNIQASSTLVPTATTSFAAGSGLVVDSACSVGLRVPLPSSTLDRFNTPPPPPPPPPPPDMVVELAPPQDGNRRTTVVYGFTKAKPQPAPACSSARAPVPKEGTVCTLYTMILVLPGTSYLTCNSKYQGSDLRPAG